MLRPKHVEFFNIPLKTFAYVGIHPLLEGNNAIIKYPFICYGLYIATFIFVLCSIDYSIKNFYHINDCTETISLLNQLLISLWKITIFFGKRQRIHKLVRDIFQWIENADEDGDEFEIISKGNKKNTLISKVYFLVVFITGVVALLLPFIKGLWKLLQGHEVTLQLPHNISFFWNTSTAAGYTVAYVWDALVIHFLAHASVAIDTLFLWTVSNILVRFTIFKIRVNKAAAQYNSLLFRSFIRDIVEFHTDILSLIKELDSIFGEIIFVQSLISCTQICFLAFCMLQKNASAINMVYPFIFLVAVSMQLILYCYNGHLIEEQSFTLCTHIFGAVNWSRVTNNHKKMLQMIMVRSQKRSHITGIFFSLNLSLYLWFFKTAGSLIAVLRTLEDKA